MRPVWQTVVNVDTDNGTCMVKSSRGNIYPVELNRLTNVEVGDEALVMKSFRGDWIMVDVEKKYPAPLTVHDFPRDEHGDLNIIEHCKYLKVIEDMSESKRVRFDEYLRKKYGCEVSRDTEPEPQDTLEALL